MNIFVLSQDTVESAKFHVNSHVVKMPLETAQMLCTNLSKVGIETPYLPVHQKHPCTKWAGESRSNFIWLCSLGINLCMEYTHRFNKVHASQEVIMFALHNSHKITDGDLTPFAQAMPDEYKDNDPVKAYRNYYNLGKRHLAKWTKRDVPYWFYKI